MLPLNTPLNQSELQVFTLENDNLRLQVMDLGATWLSCKVKTLNGWQEVLLGCLAEDYIHQSSYLGATIGRYANRIANSQFSLKNQIYSLTSNQGKHQLHGGNGFSYVRWKVEEHSKNKITFSYFSADGEDGFPGNLTIKVSYILQEQQIQIVFAGICDKDCPINLTNHAYFNLDNATQGCDVRQHFLQIFADQFLPVDGEGIPNAPLKSVENTSFDFRQGKVIQQDFAKEEQLLTKGYDHSFLLNKNQSPNIVLSSANSSIQLTIQTSYPAIQVYTGNYLAGTATRNGGSYGDFAGIALEPQFLPDSPNHPEWWHFGGITPANHKFQQQITYSFTSSP